MFDPGAYAPSPGCSRRWSVKVLVESLRRVKDGHVKMARTLPAPRSPQARRMPAQMLFHESRNEIIAVIITRLQAQIELQTGLRARLQQQIRF